MTVQRTAIVTGGSRGIGLGIAMQLAQDGCAVVIMGTSTAEAVADNLDKVRQYGQPILYVQGDLADPSHRQTLVEKTISEFGRIDILVNNAGVAPRVRLDILETSEESFDYVMGVNLKGTFFLTQAVAKVMTQQPTIHSGSPPMIINISSISAYTSSPARSEYCLSKAGLSMMTSLFADRLSQYGIYVYEVRPGIIATDMTKVVQDKYDRLIEGGLTPIRRWGQPQDVANAVSVLCSGKLSFSTGEVLNVDGGFHLRRL